MYENLNKNTLGQNCNAGVSGVYLPDMFDDKTFTQPEHNVYGKQLLKVVLVAAILACNVYLKYGALWLKRDSWAC